MPGLVRVQLQAKPRGALQQLLHGCRRATHRSRAFSGITTGIAGVPARLLRRKTGAKPRHPHRHWVFQSWNWEEAVPEERSLSFEARQRRVIPDQVICFAHLRSRSHQWKSFFLRDRWLTRDHRSNGQSGSAESRQPLLHDRRSPTPPSNKSGISAKNQSFRALASRARAIQRARITGCRIASNCFRRSGSEKTKSRRYPRFGLPSSL